MAHENHDEQIGEYLDHLAVLGTFLASFTLQIVINFSRAHLKCKYKFLPAGNKGGGGWVFQTNLSYQEIKEIC